MVINKINHHIMEATLKYNLPDEQSDFNLAVNGFKWHLVAWDLDQYFRTRLKYEEGISDQAYEAVEQARDKLRDIISEYGLSVND